MAKIVLQIWNMVSNGLDGLQFVQKRDYGQYIPKSAKHAAFNRWTSLGKRFRNSMNKVVEQNGKTY